LDPAGARNVHFSIMYRLAQGLTVPSVHWEPGAPIPEGKQPGHEADQSPLSSAEIKNEFSCSIPPLPVYVFMACVGKLCLYSVSFIC
jgi:hypothetical protein